MKFMFIVILFCIVTGLIAASLVAYSGGIGVGDSKTGDVRINENNSPNFKDSIQILMEVIDKW